MMSCVYYWLYPGFQLLLLSLGQLKHLKLFCFLIRYNMNLSNLPMLVEPKWVKSKVKLFLWSSNPEIESFYSFGCVTYFKAICLARYQIVPSNPGISLEFALHRCIYILDKLRHLSWELERKSEIRHIRKCTLCRPFETTLVSNNNWHIRNPSDPVHKDMYTVQCPL